ncbi:MAG: substrate-binding domain-containing protein [Verrucomicrobiota bacterium]
MPARCSTRATSAGWSSPPQPDPNSKVALNLESFACVSIGYSLTQPRLHVISNHQHSSTLMSLRELAALGHERIGMVSATDTLRRTEHNFESPYCFFQSIQDEARRIPLFAVAGRDEPANVNRHREAFLEWFRRYRPTAIISTVSEVRGWLDAAGFSVPSEVSVATLSRIHDAGWSGIDQQERQIGARAVELLISLFQSGERGAPGTPIRLLVEGRWITGDSTRKLGPPAMELLKRLG